MVKHNMLKNLEGVRPTDTRAVLTLAVCSCYADQSFVSILQLSWLYFILTQFTTSSRDQVKVWFRKIYFTGKNTPESGNLDDNVICNVLRFGSDIFAQELIFSI